MQMEKMEWYGFRAKQLPMPEHAFGLSFEDNRDVILLYMDDKDEPDNAVSSGAATEVKPRRDV